MRMLGNGTYVFECSSNVQRIKSWQSFYIHKLIHSYSSAPKDWFSFQELPNMTHFSTQSSLSRELWMQFLDSWKQTEDLVVRHSRYICDFETPLRFKNCLLPCFCWITRQNVMRICPEFPSERFFLLLLAFLWPMALSVCVQMRVWWVQPWHVARVPLFWENAAKGLLIWLIKCFMATGPALYPLPQSHFHPIIVSFYDHILDTCHILVIGCQWLFLPVKFKNITLRFFKK